MIAWCPCPPTYPYPPTPPSPNTYYLKFKSIHSQYMDLALVHDVVVVVQGTWYW